VQGGGDSRRQIQRLHGKEAPAGSEPKPLQSDTQAGDIPRQDGAQRLSPGPVLLERVRRRGDHRDRGRAAMHARPTPFPELADDTGAAAQHCNGYSERLCQ
jgi:hypothetical protein